MHERLTRKSIITRIREAKSAFAEASVKTVLFRFEKDFWPALARAILRNSYRIKSNFPATCGYCTLFDKHAIHRLLVISLENNFRLSMMTRRLFTAKLFTKNCNQLLMFSLIASQCVNNINPILYSTRQCLEVALKMAIRFKFELYSLNIAIFRLF